MCHCKQTKITTVYTVFMEYLKKKADRKNIKMLIETYFNLKKKRQNFY